MDPKPFLAVPGLGKKTSSLRLAKRYRLGEADLRSIDSFVRTRLPAPDSPKGRLAAVLAEKVDIPRRTSAQYLDALTALAYKEAKKGFVLPGIGKLVVRDRRSRQGRNPQTGETIRIVRRPQLKLITQLSERGPRAKSRLAAVLAKKVDISKTTSAKYLEALAALAAKEAKHGFVIPGIGKLVVRKHGARMGRNPQTGEAIKVPTRDRLKFVAAKVAEQAILSGK